MKIINMWELDREGKILVIGPSKEFAGELGQNDFRKPQVIFKNSRGFE
jgi:hypothetical protein